LRGYKLGGKKLDLPDNYCAKLIDFNQSEIKFVDDLNEVKVWDVNLANLDSFLTFTDAISIGSILSE
jgi:hypothetical protein